MPVNNQSRSRIIQIMFAIVFLVIIAQLLHLQVFSSKYRMQADSNARYRKVVYPDRGIVYDRKKRAILENVIMYDLMITPSEIKGTDTFALCNILNIDTAEFKKRVVNAIVKNSPYKESVFEPLLSQETYARLNENMYKFPGFVLYERPVRSYPYNCAANVLGYIGEVDSQFLRRRAEQGYEMGDYAGVTGLELSYEKVLMGQRGIQYYIRDNRSRLQGSYENGRFDTAATAGRNLYSSMDVELQQLAEKLFTNKIGAAVAIDPKTGGILAMATGPTYDPNQMTGIEKRKNFNRLYTDTAKPLYNRAIKGQYPPGSTFKPLGALVALDEHLITPAYGYPCGGAYVTCGKPVRCTHAGGGHAANLRIALANSCNSYFVQIFRMAVDNPQYKKPQDGYAKWKEYMNRFGLGVRLGVDLPSEDAGLIPTVAGYNKDFGGPGRWVSCNILTLGIGQDRMLTTPLQMANAMCIIANKGYYYTPHFIDSIAGETIDDTVYMAKYREKHIVTNINSEAVESVKLGMEDVAKFGTASRITVPGVEYGAKTGTAQNPHGNNHSWFVCFAPADDPKIAVAVIVENAGYGATWAGPIAAFMMEKYLNDTIASSRKADLDRIVNADLRPEAIKNFYKRKDAERLAKLKLDENTAPIFPANPESKKIEYDPDAESGKNQNKKGSSSNQEATIPQDKKNKPGNSNK